MDESSTVFRWQRYGEDNFCEGVRFVCVTFRVSFAFFQPFRHKHRIATLVATGSDASLASALAEKRAMLETLWIDEALR